MEHNIIWQEGISGYAREGDGEDAGETQKYHSSYSNRAAFELPSGSFAAQRTLRSEHPLKIPNEAGRMVRTRMCSRVHLGWKRGQLEVT